MLAALLVLLMLSTAEDRAPADPQRVKAAIVELEKAWKSTEAGARARAIQQSGGVADAEVIKLVARGLRDKEPDVQRAAIEALRWIEHPDALKELQSAAKDERLKKDPALVAALLRGVGQHGSPSSIALLADDLWSTQDERVLQARVLGLGRIRTKEAAEKLFTLLTAASAEKLQPALADFRLALAALTGADQGSSPARWQAWWNEHRAQLVIASAAPELPPELERKWKAYWGTYELDERGKKRHERGKGDPQRSRAL